MVDPQFPARLLQLDEITRAEHYYICAGDVCFHLWEYVKGGRVQEYSTNQLILNLQIPLSDRTQNVYRWRYKGQAIRYSARALSQVVPRDFFDHFTWVPVPPSAAKDSPLHDTRLIQILRAVHPPVPDVRELVFQDVDHESKAKGFAPEARAAEFRINEDVANPAPTRIVLFDDVLTTGSHYKAMQMILSARFPGVPIMGVFLARTIRPGETAGFEIDLDALLKKWTQ